MRLALEDAGRRTAAQKKHMEKLLPAPVGGWSSNSSIAKENPGAAEVLENFIPTTRGVRARGGSVVYASVGIAPVLTLMTYEGGASDEMFAVSGGGIYDVTAIADPLLIPTAVSSGLTNNELSYVNYSIAGTNYLVAFNGADLHRVYDGATWATNTPAITGVSSASINQAWIHGNRMWMVEAGTKTAWYLSVDSIGGAANSFSPFQKGGNLLFGATWSQDSGSGSADRCVFVSTNGEVAVYYGENPGAAATWQLFGRYDVAPPLGRYAFQKVGGDLLIMTVSGIVSMSEVVSKDPAALTATAITKFIEPDWKKATDTYADKNWRFLKWDAANIGVVAVPSTIEQQTAPAAWGSTFIWGVTEWGEDVTIDVLLKTPRCFVVNLQTGRWSLVTGWDCRSMTVFNGKFYFGTSVGRVVQGDEGGNDMGASYICKLAYWPSRFDHLGEKQFLQAAAVFEHSTTFIPKVSMSTNNVISWPSAPVFPPEDNASGTWDSGVWDGAVFDAVGEKRVSYERWVSINKRGRVGALMLQLSFNNTTTPVVEFTDAIVTYEKAAVVT